MESSIRLLPVTGGALACQTVGNGHPIVFTHPYAMPSQGAPAIPGLRTISIWPRGIGNSSPPRNPSDYALVQRADDLEQARLVLEIAHWTCWGLSMGGFVSLIYALRYPGAVAALVLDSSAASYAYASDPESVWPTLGASTEAQRFRSDPTPEHRAAYYARMRNLQLAKDPAYRAPEGIEINDAALTYILGNLGEYDVRDRLHEIAAPALVLAGGRDGQCAPAQSRAVAAGMQRARLEEFPELGHGIIREDRVDVLDIVRDFVFSTATRHA